MRNVLRNWSLLSALIATNVVLALTYLGLVAFSISYATLEVEFAQSVKNEGAEVATLDAQYLAGIQAVTATSPLAEGYTEPVTTLFVPGSPSTAINFP